MDLRSVSDIINRGGTILYSARSVEFATEEGMRKAIRTCQEYGIEGVVVIGGDGSFRGARDLSERGIPCVGIPGTIDNDIACCDNTIGYDTCLNTIMEMVDRVRDTTESHDRCTVVEVMGRRAGYLALNAGIACGATSILIPEIDYDIQEHIIERMEKTQRTGKKHFIIIVAEGVDVDVTELAKTIEAKTGVESRACVLGHIQRGGSPSAKDRVLATRMGIVDVMIAERVAAYLADHVGDNISLRTIAAAISPPGRLFSPNTIEAYLTALERAHLIERCYRWDATHETALKSKYRVYFIDTALRTARFGFFPTDGERREEENRRYIELRRNHPHVYLPGKCDSTRCPEFITSDSTTNQKPVGETNAKATSRNRAQLNG